MDLITVIIIGVIVAATGVINPKAKDTEEVAKAPETQVTTPEVKEPEPEPEPQPEPDQPVQEETPTETIEEEPQSENNDQSSNNDDENINR